MDYLHHNTVVHLCRTTGVPARFGGDVLKIETEIGLEQTGSEKMRIAISFECHFRVQQWNTRASGNAAIYVYQHQVVRAARLTWLVVWMMCVHSVVNAVNARLIKLGVDATPHSPYTTLVPLIVG